MSIVRAMKQTNRHSIRCACAGAIMLSMAPWVGAQAPTPPPGPAAPPAPPAAPEKLTNEQASYLFGLTFGEQLHAIGVTGEVQPDVLERGVKDAMAGKKATPVERQQIQEFVRTVMTASGAHNKAAAQDFLAKNGKEKGVQTTPTGLQYKVVKPGDAKAAPIVASDEVTVNYRGKLLDGTEFDSSYSRGIPASFPVSGVIKGWQEALVLMKPGAKWELYVPPELAYGSNPRPGIPANSLLVFDVELLSVKPRQTAPAAAPKPTAPASPPTQQ
jgi:FKBP-type peptidyl-prolyl cis-trans isomerase FklB